ncbi:hypothetical protein [Roseateles sp.]|uniref:hypothetical protein n=1 Tax=Roseateles sp. TaxID=1971397 RepID=UPI0039EC736E
MRKAALIVEADELRTRTLASLLDEAGYRAEYCVDAEAAIARLAAGEAAALLVIDLDYAADTLTLLRSFHCTHDLPPLLAMTRGIDAARTAEALADGAALVFDWATPAAALRQALQALQRPAAEGRLGGEVLGAHLGAAGLEARIGLAQVIEQQGRRLLQEAVHGWLAGRAQEAAAAATRLEQVARRLGAHGLVGACRQLAGEGGTGLLLQQRAARVRQELDGLVCGLGRAALDAPRWVREGELDGLPSRAS